MLIYELMAKLAEYPAGTEVVIQQTDENGNVIFSLPISLIRSFTEGDSTCVIGLPDSADAVEGKNE